MSLGVLTVFGASSIKSKLGAQLLDSRNSDIKIDVQIISALYS